ncbi:hypothetical protein ACIQRN_22475 [[Kitasatospora] papulosa]|uniref:hypothetical protein n=1 Tax=[Kitasatospora] papulosa TaxID=1464011 RepID=UPI0038042DBF
MARFDEVRATFWGEGLYGDQPPLTDAVVQDAECQLGVCLPASLLEIDLDSGRARAVQGACAPVVPIDLADDEPLEAPHDVLG